MARKESRLSTIAKELLNRARLTYSTQPMRAIECLRSVDPSELNMYDRQKIGREILARVDIVSHLGPNFANLNLPTERMESEEHQQFEGMATVRYARKISADYGVEVYPRCNPREKPHEFSSYEQEKIHRVLFPPKSVIERLEKLRKMQRTRYAASRTNKI